MLGIYAIKHRATGNTYVGQSVRIEIRFREHRKALNQGKHYNVKLQRAWAKYGEAEFDFLVLEQCEARQLNEREQFYLNQKPWFNVCEFADSGMRGRVHSEETRVKMSKAWETRKDKSPNKGATPTPEVRAKISAALKGRALSEETRVKMSAARKGKRVPPEAAAKVSASKMGVANVKVRKAVRCVETGQVFESLKSAAEYLQGDSATLSNHLKGRKPRFKGFTFEYVRGEMT
jgi:group I intron endonuclease